METLEKTNVTHPRDECRVTEGELPPVLSSVKRLPRIDLLPESMQKQGGKDNSKECSSLSEESELLHDNSTHSSLSVPFTGNRIRRRSAPSMLEPIQEGLLGISNRRNSNPGPHLLSVDRKGKIQNLADLQGAPTEQKYSILSQRRRSDPIGLVHTEDRLKTFSYESRYPAPRRNSLVSATLDELTSQFELLDRRKQVVEESEVGDSDVPTLPPILITDA